MDCRVKAQYRRYLTPHLWEVPLYLPEVTEEMVAVAAVAES